jgi:hypothetical protein
LPGTQIAGYSKNNTSQRKNENKKFWKIFQKYKKQTAVYLCKTYDRGG